MNTNLPADFTRNILGLNAREGADWLARLPEIIAEIEQNWSLKVAAHFPNLSYHYVAPCVAADGSRAVLKIGFPGEKANIFNEAKMLELFDGNGAAKLLRFDKKRFAFLLEKLTPGENLVKMCEHDDAKATSIAIAVMRRLFQNAPKANAFPSLENWIGSVEKSEACSPAMVKKARRFFDELISTSKKNFLLHGDLHHQNILSATREPYLAIDPKGIVGDAGFEIATFLNNPRGWLLTHPDRGKILANRIEQFSAAFEIEPLVLRKWAFAEAVLSAVWTFEENRADWEKWISCAEIWEV